MKAFPTPGAGGLPRKAYSKGGVSSPGSSICSELKSEHEEQKTDGLEEAENYPLDVQGSRRCQAVWGDSEDLPVDTQPLIPPGDLAGGQLWWILGKIKSCGHQASGMTLRSSCF